MEKLIKSIAQALVDQPDKVDIKEIKLHHAFIFELRVAKEDVGKIIGKKGKTANAIRTILSCVSAQNQKKALLDIID